MHDQIGGGSIREGLRRQLPSNIFVQFLAGPTDVRDSAFGYLLRAIAWVTLVVAPVLLLLLMQIQFLPFHNSFITWAQRVALLADLVLLWWLWRRILSGREPGRWLGPSWLWSIVVLAFTFGAFLFFWTAATLPGEWQEHHLPNWRVFPAFDENGKPTKVSLHDWVFKSRVRSHKPPPLAPFEHARLAWHLNIYEGLAIDDPEKVKWREYVFRARGRELKGAIFDLATLPKVDFEGAELDGASFASAQLQGASLKKAALQGASLDSAQLQGATLIGAQLQGASLEHARLQGAWLVGLLPAILPSSRRMKPSHGESRWKVPASMARPTRRRWRRC